MNKSNKKSFYIILGAALVIMLAIIIPLILTGEKVESNRAKYFPTYTDIKVNSRTFTDEEKFILFDAVADIIQPDDIVTTEGGVTPGGISALKHMPFHGFEIIGKNSGQHVYWASDRLLDREKFDKWIQHADKDDYRINNKQMPLTVENTRPVVKILRKR